MMSFTTPAFSTTSKADSRRMLKNRRTEAPPSGPRPPSEVKPVVSKPPQRRLAGLLLVLLLLPGLPGCEYFTSERLDWLKPPPTRKTEGVQIETDDETASTATAKSMTPADLVALLERIVRGNRRELDDLRNVLEERTEERGEEVQARDVFQTLDDLINGLERERRKAEAEQRADRIAEIDRQLQSLRKPWELARQRLNLNLRARMLMLERVNILEDGIAHDQRRLEAILDSGDPSSVLSEPKPKPKADEAEAPPANEKPTTTETKTTTTKSETKTPAKVDAQSLLLGASGMAPKPSADEPKDKAAKSESEKSDASKPEEAETEEPKTEEPQGEETKTTEPTAPPPSKELISAKRELEVKSTAVQQLRERTVTLDARIKSIARSIELLQQLAQVANESLENATQTRAYLIEEMESGKPSVALQAWVKLGGDPIARVDQRIKSARENAEKFGERHELLVEERDMINDALQNLAQRAQSAKETLDKAQEKVEALESPFSSHRILSWIRHSAPPMLGTILVMMLLYLLITRYSHKIVQVFATHGMRGSKSERDNRMETLVSVLQNTGGALVLVGGTLTLLGQLGVPVGPLLGGAAVAGVAVAFGAQNLIKDFFYGFMILLENQYKLNDVVKIDDHSGSVEQITLRMTALRDLGGALHFLPNGATTSVVNMTHGWSRALFYVRICIDEDVERVIEIIQDLGKELRQDPAFRLMIVDDLTMLGVDDITETAITLVFFIKTLPVKQWEVKREFLKRLKKKFDEHKVSLPAKFVIERPR